MKRITLLAVIATVLVGCKADPATQSAESIDKPAVPASAHSAPPRTNVPVGQSTIAGTVDFTGKPPAKVLIDTSMDPACGMGGSPGPVYTEQYVAANGHLANVFVYVKSGPPAAMQSGIIAEPVKLDQKGCQYTPHVVGVVQGGSVQFLNSDVTMHNIHTMPATVGNQSIDISQGPRGAPVIRQFMKPEMMMPVRCNNHPWMNAFINVAPTPFFAVSDAQGRFTIAGLPPGTYILGAVHEKLGEKDLSVTVPPTGTAAASFTFTAQ